MSCNSPISAWELSERSDTGKRIIVFKPRGSLSGKLLSLPCGKCTGCRLEWARGWAVRCLHESKMHKDNCFLTLTYNNEHLPSNGSLVPRHFQLFMKKLRRYCEPHQIRFYGCGEYGDLNKRPHYHILIFGFQFPDLRLYSKSGDTQLFTSKILDKLWSFGDCKIGEVNYETAGYVARYCLKKVDGAKREAGHYLVYDSDGVVSERVPEFSRQSRRPGIGFSYVEKYGSALVHHDSIIVNGREVPSIRYYDKLIEKFDARAFRGIKRDRAPSSLQELHDAMDDSTPRRRFVKEQLAKATLKQKARKL